VIFKKKIGPKRDLLKKEPRRVSIGLSRLVLLNFVLQRINIYLLIK
jgi:hypothetical protein